MNCSEVRVMAAAWKCDPEKQVRMALLQEVYPQLFSGHTYSDDSYAEDYGLERERTEIHTILSNYNPGCPR